MSTRQCRLFRSAVTVAVMICSVAISKSVWAQAGLREALERLDVDKDGVIQPDEVTPLSRPYLERITKERRIPLEKPVPIHKLQEAARIYYALQNGVAGKDVLPEGESKVKSFGPDPDQPIVPEFGLGKMKFPYIQADVDLANKIMGKYDDNGDGFIDRAEAAEHRWTHRNPFDDDLDEDDRISRLELTQRYARRRLLSDDSDELVQRARRTGGEIESSTDDGRKEDQSQWWKKGGTSHWLTAALVGRFDRNRNGRLEPDESQQLGFPTTLIDTNHDGELTRDELFVYVVEMQDDAGDVTSGLPGWFFEMDRDRDGQVALHEFSEDRSLARLAEFDAMDLNNDGLLTSSEVLQSKAVTGGDFRNDNVQVLPPHRTIISEIEVEDEFLIRDLNVQISITHSNTGFLDGYLIGPEGQRVELFTEVGGSGNHFERTTFDDQSSNAIAKARAPFEGTYRPEAIDNRQPGLWVFNNKSAKGIWQLIIRGSRSERFGMLHSWGLTIVPVEQVPVVSADAETEVASEDSLETPGSSPSMTAESFSEMTQKQPGSDLQQLDGGKLKQKLDKETRLKRKIEKQTEKDGRSLFEKLADQLK